MKDKGPYSFGAIKVDMGKVYDRVSRVFLKSILMAMNFSPR